MLQSKYSTSPKSWHRELFPEPGTPDNQRIELFAHADSRRLTQKDLLTIFLYYNKKRTI
jgi:hypothetical protein